MALTRSPEATSVINGVLNRSEEVNDK